MSGHARLMPSKSNQWLACALSVTAQEAMPETERSESAEEGSAAHEVAYKVLSDFLYWARKGHSFNRADFLDTVASNGVVISDEMLDAVEMYVADVINVSRRYGGDAHVLLEYSVRMPMIHEDNAGTLDNCVIFFGGGSDTLVITDFKYGWILVEPEENSQLLDYAIGVVHDMFQRNKTLPTNIELRIVQPRPSHRAGKVRTWTIPLTSLQQYVDKFRQAALAALGPNPLGVAGTHCAFCSARKGCIALRSSVYSAIEIVTGETPFTLDNAELGSHIKLLRRIQELVKAQLSGFETQALSELQAGKPVEGWDWERSNGNLKWSKPLDEVHVLGDLMGVDTRAKGAITPLQAIAAGISEDVIKLYSSRPPGKINLVPASTKKSTAIFKPT